MAPIRTTIVGVTLEAELVLVIVKELTVLRAEVIDAMEVLVELQADVLTYERKG